MLSEDEDIPLHTNVCRLFWRFIFNLPVFLILAGIVFLVVVPMVSVGGFFVARRVAFKNQGADPGLIIPFKHWPTIRGHRIYPAVPVLAFALLYVLWQAIVKFGDDAVRLISSNTTLIASGGIVLVALLIYGVNRFMDSDAGHLFAEWILAKKERVCPIIRIVD